MLVENENNKRKQEEIKAKEKAMDVQA